jgi:O-antigen ligase
LILSVILGVAVTLIDLKLLAIMVAGTIAAALFFIRFDLGVLLFVVLVPLTIQLPVSIHHLISYSLSGILGFSWLIRKLASARKLSSIDSWLILFMFVYLLWSGICSLASSYPAEGLFITFRSSLFFIIFYILFDWMKTERRLNMILNAMILVGVISSLAVLLELVQEGVSSVITYQGMTRFTGLYGNPNTLGMHLAVIFPLALGRFVYLDLPKKRWWRFLYVLSIGLALFLTFSRSAWLAVLVSSCVIFSKLKWGRWFLFVIVCSLILFVLVSPDLRDLAIKVSRIEQGATFRPLLWQGGIGIFKDHLLFGVGPGAFKYHIAQYFPAYPWRWPVVRFAGVAGGDSHNFFITKGAEMGLVGMLLGFFLFGAFFRVYFSSMRKSEGAPLHYLVGVCGAIVVSFFVRAFFEGQGLLTRGGLAHDMYFWILIAFTIRVGELSLTERVQVREKAKKSREL